jgi:exosortase C (VPDSG-CTERM-specific)
MPDRTEEKKVGQASPGDSSGTGQAFGNPAVRRFCFCLAVLGVCFWKPLADWVRNALEVDLYSHGLLMPFVVGYFVWLRRREIPENGRPSWVAAALLAGCGVASLAGYWHLRQRGVPLPENDYLALTLLAFLCFSGAGALASFGWERLRPVAFPLALLIFVPPLPSAFRLGVDVFLQHATAEVVAVLFWMSGTPVLREGLIFQLPGIRLGVAEECSGIRSTLALFITSLMAGYLFLRSPWKRTALVAFVVPLGIARNAFRILVIAMLCVHVDPSMIDSYIHRKGGPVFFVLSVVPLAILLILLRRSETKLRNPAGGEIGSPDAALDRELPHPDASRHTEPHRKT